MTEPACTVFRGYIFNLFFFAAPTRNCENFSCQDPSTQLLLNLEIHDFDLFSNRSCKDTTSFKPLECAPTEAKEEKHFIFEVFFKTAITFFFFNVL